MSTNRLRIGVTMRVMAAKGYEETRDALAQDWALFLKTAFPTAAWMPIANVGAGSIREHCESWGINRLVLTGGDDIGVFPLRDETERELLDWAVERGVPVLGICRGMEVMAVRAGGALKPVSGHIAKRHVLRGEMKHEVNSFHNHALAECPAGFVVLASAEDGEIEAIRSTALGWEGWMWHPEREMPFNESDIDRLRVLFG